MEFARNASMITQLERFPNLVVLRTLSKAYALAGARCGALLAQPDIVSFNFKLLEDDKALQPAQNIVGVATAELADAAPADFAETINAINAALTTEVLTQLGVEIVVDQTDMADVARNFLQDNGLL